MTTVVDAARDLLLGGACCVCARPGRVLCAPCADALPSTPRQVWPTPSPPGLAPPWAMGDYAGPLRAMVLGHKEHHLWALTGALGDLLEDVIAAAVPLDRPVLLVPVPSRAAAVRQRGHDATRALVQAAARRLRRRGVAVAVAPVLRLRPGVLDQAGLDAAGRASNLHRSMWVPPQALRRAARLARPGRVVLCDDVLTTGATAREGQRALEGVGLLLSAIATVAATRRRVAADL